MSVDQRRHLFVLDAYAALRRQLEKWADQNEGDKRHEIRTQIATLAGWWAKTERL